MINDFDKYLKFLIEKKLTPNRFAICWMIETKAIDSIRLYQETVGGFKESDFEYLIKEDYLINVNVDGTLDIANLITTPKFSEELFIDEEVALWEIINIYPKSFRIEGKSISLLNVDLEHLERKYGRIIKGNKSKHKEILEKTKRVVKMMDDGDLNYMGIGKYITGHNWTHADGDLADKRGAFTQL